MAEIPPAPLSAPDRAFAAQSEPHVMSGAGWFWWIAGLSVVNTIMAYSDGGTTFAIGLGFTLVVDAVFKAHKFIALAIDAVALGLFFGFGFFARRGYLWAFITGIVLYALDGVIYVLFQSWMSVAFHGLALFYMIRGAKALHVALKTAVTVQPPSLAAVPPA